MSTIYVIMGMSGAGKDTAGKYIIENHNGILVKFAAPGKRALEHILKVEPGLLDDRVKRQEVAPHCQGRTYLEVLIDFWQNRHLVIGKDLFTAQTMGWISNILSLNHNVVITDCRNLDEMEAILKLVIGQKGKVSLRVIWLDSVRAKEERSDTYQKHICYTLCYYADTYQFINNNGTRKKLYRELDKHHL